MNEAVDSLNWLAGRGSSTTFTPSPVQRQVLSRLDGLASCQPKGGVPVAEEALRELLGGFHTAGSLPMKLSPPTRPNSSQSQMM